jgi:hypothetical protein
VEGIVFQVYLKPPLALGELDLEENLNLALKKYQKIIHLIDMELEAMRIRSLSSISTSGSSRR